MTQQGPGWTLAGKPENGSMTRYIIVEHSHDGVQQFEMAPGLPLPRSTDTGVAILPQAHGLSTENAPLPVNPADLENTQFKDSPPADDSPTLDIIINNVVSCFTTRCHLNLKRIAQEGANVIYRRDCGVSGLDIKIGIRTKRLRDKTPQH